MNKNDGVEEHNLYSPSNEKCVSFRCPFVTFVTHADKKKETEWKMRESLTLFNRHDRILVTWGKNSTDMQMKRNRESKGKTTKGDGACNWVVTRYSFCLSKNPDLDIFFTFIVHNIALVVAFVREQSSLTQVPCGSTSCQRNWDEILLVTPFTDLSLSFSWYFLSDQKMKTHRLKDRESRWLEEYSVCQENRENLPIIP